MRLGYIKARLVEMVVRILSLQVISNVQTKPLALFPDISSIHVAAILVPHPDDEVIGCYHFINEIGKSVAVDLYYVTDGGAGGIHGGDVLVEQRAAESNRAIEGLPIRKRDWWGFPDGKLDDHRVALQQRLAALGEYDLVLCPAPTDITPDHAVLADVTLLAVNIEKLLWYRSTWLTFPLWISDFAIGGEASQKRKALKCFFSQSHLALGNTITLSEIESKFCGLDTFSIEAFRFAKSGNLDWQPVNVLSIGAIGKLKEWY